MRKSVHKKIKTTWDDKLFDFICNFFLVVLVLIVFYPLYYVVIASISDPMYATTGEPLLYPKGVTFQGVTYMLHNKKLWASYANTILYTVCGTLIGVVMTILCGYAFSRKDLPGSGILMKILVFTMYFNGGMIPTFLVVKNLGLYNSRLIMIIMGAFSAYNVIIVRSTMKSTIPDELLEAARVDGCGNGRFFLQFVLPLSKAIIAVMVLYIAVGYWNAYMTGVLYLQDTSKYTLQQQLRILLGSVSNDTLADSSDPNYYALMMENMRKAQLMKYSAIVVSAVPVICIYPFIQKYFVKGVMIGSIKG